VLGVDCLTHLHCVGGQDSGHLTFETVIVLCQSLGAYMEHGLRLLASLTERTVSADVQRVKLSVYNFQLHCQKHLREAEEEEEEEEIY